MMNTKLLITYSFILISLGSLCLNRSMAVDFNAFGGAAINQSHFSDPNINNSIGFGTEVSFGIGETLGVEFGAIYLGEASTYGTSISAPAITQYFLDMPLMVRYTPFKPFSILAGGYYGFRTGVDHYYSSTGSVTSSQANNFSPKDYGQIFGASFQFPVSTSINIRLEGTYQHGNSNISSSSLYTEYTRVLTFWLGAQVAFDWKFLKPSFK